MTNTTLSNCQQEALDAFLDFIDSDDPWMVISGFAGSGKSFLVEYMADVAKNVLNLQRHLSKTYKAPTLYFTATTNKAAAVLTDMLGREACTIHSLLGLKVNVDYNTGKQRLVPKSSPKAVTDSIIFIDEASMINRELLHYINEYQQKSFNCKLVFIGDPYQLPPVKESPCNVFNAPTNHFFLNEIQRQVVGNPIIQLSAKYRDVLDDPELPWPRIDSDNKHIFFYDDRTEFEAAIINSMGKPHNAELHKILAWKNNTVREYNDWIRGMHGYTEPFELNEVMMTNKPLVSKDKIYGATDSLHRIVDIETWNEWGVEGYKLATVNAHKRGDVVYVFQPGDWQDADILLKQFKKDKNWRAFYHIKETWADLRPIHALTCHKSQGSTYEEVFVDLDDIGKNTLWQECARLAYVAVTRASERLHIYGGINNNYPSKKTNELLEKFKNVEHLI